MHRLLESNDVETKTCSKCGETKPLTFGYFNALPSGNWRGTCKICMAANTRRHYEAHPEKVIARVAKYKEQKAAAGGSYTNEDIDQIRCALDDRCAYCGDSLNGGGEIDHKTPVSKGGDSSPDNLTLACRTCNRDKHSKTSNEFFAWRRSHGLTVRGDEL
jgi:5-methylcytosine-specific restriction endonuclease McrA